MKGLDIRRDRTPVALRKLAKATIYGREIAPKQVSTPRH